MSLLVHVPSDSQTRCSTTVSHYARHAEEIEGSATTAKGAKPTFDGFPNWTDECSSLVRKHLTREVYLMCENRYDLCATVVQGEQHTSSCFGSCSFI